MATYAVGSRLVLCEHEARAEAVEIILDELLLLVVDRLPSLERRNHLHGRPEGNKSLSMIAHLGEALMSKWQI